MPTAAEQARFYRHVGQIVREHREAQHISLTDLSKLIGTAHTTIDRWEHGEHCPSIYHVTLVARALGITPDAILHETLDRMGWNNNNDDADIIRQRATNTPRRMAITRRFVQLDGHHQDHVEQIVDLIIGFAETVHPKGKKQ